MHFHVELLHMSFLIANFIASYLLGIFVGALGCLGTSVSILGEEMRSSGVEQWKILVFRQDFFP